MLRTDQQVQRFTGQNAARRSLTAPIDSSSASRTFRLVVSQSRLTTSSGISPKSVFQKRGVDLFFLPGMAHPGQHQNAPVLKW